MLRNPSGSQIMQTNTRLYLCLALVACSILAAGKAMGWGSVGHSVIGNAAVAQLNAATRGRLMEILGVDSADTLGPAVDRACSWPDTVRDTPPWSASAPLHYVNIPRSSTRYDRQRDCADGLCVTEGVLKYAAELGRPGLDPERRWQAFAWLCHLVGDLHQPLHAGFRDDRGGNEVEIVFRGERSNLHRFWDSLLVDERLPDAESLAAAVTRAAQPLERTEWEPADVASWTNESHALAQDMGYPPGPEIGPAFAEASWAVVEQQWRRAAGRLALLLDEVLGPNGAEPATAD
jgi:hypothetical protein